jgi:hypothetical protein
MKLMSYFFFFFFFCSSSQSLHVCLRMKSIYYFTLEKFKNDVNIKNNILLVIIENDAIGDKKKRTKKRLLFFSLLILKVVDIFYISEIKTGGDYLFVTCYDNELSMRYTYDHHLGSNKKTLTKCLVYILYHIYVTL